MSLHLPILLRFCKPSVYSAVIFDVVNRIRQYGSEIEVEESVLEDLQRVHYFSLSTPGLWSNRGLNLW